MSFFGNIVKFTRKERVATIALVVFAAGFVSVQYYFKAPIIGTPPEPEYTTRQKDSLFVFDPNTADTTTFKLLGFSSKQSAIIVSYRYRRKWFNTPEEFAECFVVHDTMFKRLLPYIKISPAPVVKIIKTSLNEADSSHLTAINGIGEGFCKRISEYRERLGGFVDFGQLAEVGLDDSAIRRCREYFFIKVEEITKIDINFAPANTLVKHPYMSKSIVGRVLKQRELKGGWSNITEMKNQDVLLPHEAEKLAPYLIFNTERAVN